MEFDALPENVGKAFAIRGFSQMGKTHLSHMLNGVDRTYVADTHSTNSTIETCMKLGNTKYRRIRTWADLMAYARAFATEVEPPATFVLDSGSDMVTMAQKNYEFEYGKKPFEYSWAVVWSYIYDFLSTVISRGGDIVLTIMLREIRDPKTNLRIPGEYEPKQWKDLKYQLSAGFTLMRGLNLGGTQWFPYWRFIRIDGSRYVGIDAQKPLLVGEFARPNIMRQLNTEYFGTARTALNEFYANLYESVLPRDKRFCADISTLLGSDLLSPAKFKEFEEKHLLGNQYREDGTMLNRQPAVSEHAGSDGFGLGVQDADSTAVIKSIVKEHEDKKVQTQPEEEIIL